MNHIPEKIKRRISALRAMAADTSSENEAMIAARKLHSILAKYGIDDIEIEDDGDQMGESHSTVQNSEIGVWAGVIAKCVGELYFCSVYQERVRGKGRDRTRTFNIVGRKDYRVTAKLMIDYVIKAVDKNARSSSKSDRPKGVDGWAYICSFRNAAAQRIAARCRELIEAGRKGELSDEEGNNLPVLAPMYDKHTSEAEAWLRGEGVDLTNSKCKFRSSSWAGATAGDRFGNEVGLNNQIGKSAKARLLGN